MGDIEGNGVHNEETKSTKENQEDHFFFARLRLLRSFVVDFVLFCEHHGLNQYANLTRKTFLAGASKTAPKSRLKLKSP